MGSERALVDVRETALQLSDDAVALADAQELVAVIVDGDDPRDLFECELGICRFGALQVNVIS